MYSKLQYISQGLSAEEQLVNIKKVLDNGCIWIQLRFKNKPHEEVLTLAEQVRNLTEQYSSTLIINDSIDIAKHVNADGVHLGLQDADISLARAFLGSDKVIGGTANTIQHIKQRVAENCNYIGLGPFRYTETKQNLSPILGLAGYQTILSQISKEESTIPVYAIGGIQLDDIDAILNAGIYGVAISAALTQSHQSDIIQKILVQKDEKPNYSRSGV
ncbi:thiamine phosphate synthase [Arcticibacter sp.]|jgi:thiamine-phosphate pyrophosphorylase|uniref:thiamine phosphate synthase n=1 Tax=Arcticibacter sp. TaxID=1872630 RepID=UPI00388F618C